MRDLKKLISEGYNEYRIILSGGLMFSRKDITFNEKLKKFKIINHIDDSEQFLTEKELLDNSFTNIGQALKKRALIVDLTENNKTI